MIKKLLTPLGVPFRETMFTRTPEGDYAVYHDDVEAGGADLENCIYTHDITVELYEAKPNPTLEAAMEAALNAADLKWSKQSRYWIPEAKRYQVIYEFTYIIKT